MSKRPIPAVANDFADVLALLKERRTIPQNANPSLIINAKRIHGLTYSLILWRFRLRRLQPHAKVFIEEIASDALQILPQILMGYSKTAKLLIRGVAENTLRHIYFSDHPVEYERMNREKKWYLTMDDLCGYTKTHPDFIKNEKKFDAINQILSLYSDLSGGVHGRTVSDLEMRVALLKIAYDEAAAAEEIEHLRKCVEAANFLLAIFHRTRVRALSTEDRRIILRSIPARARDIWGDYE